jgi:hypothetical protein
VDTELLVENELDEGQLLIDQLIRDGFDVSVAFWAKTSDDGSWRLFIGSPVVETGGATTAYHRVYSSLGAIHASSIEPSTITLLNEKDPTTQTAIKLRDRLPSKIPTRYHGRRLDGLSVAEAYIYPKTEIPLRQSFIVSYVRQGETNIWLATTRRREFYRGLKSAGAMSLSTGLWLGDKPGDEKFAHVYVLVEVDPLLDEQTITAHPSLLITFAEQARLLADEMFKKKHPDSVIEHVPLKLEAG